MMIFHQPRIGFFIFCGLAIFFIKPSYADQLVNQTVNQTVNLQNQEMLSPAAPEESKVQVFKFDLKKFSGERIPLDREYSNQIKSIQMNFTFPPQCSFVMEAPSFINIFTAEQKLIAKVDILGLKTLILLGQTIESEHLYLQVMLNYSCEGKKASLKNVLFDAPLVKYPKAEDIKIQYNLNP